MEDATRPYKPPKAPDETKVNDALGEATRLSPAADPTLVKSSMDKTQIHQPNVKQHAKTKQQDSAAQPLKILKGRFELIENIGSGGMGDVYLAKDLIREEMEDSTPYVALKLLKGDFTKMREAIQALQREAKKAQTLSHPNIVTVYDFDRDGDTAFITMEYLPGQSIKEYLQENNVMPYKEAMNVIEQISRGLAYAHQEGFVHADIKPPNIYLQMDGGVKILDFGIAKAFRDSRRENASASDEWTKTALTPAYASVQMLAGEAQTPADDIYGLACVAYLLLTGEHPFLDDKGMPIPANIAKAKGLQPQPIKGVSRRHMRALQRGLSFDADKRYQNAGDFIDAIKKRNLQKDLALLSIAVIATAFFIFTTQFGLEQVTPIVDNLPETMNESKALIKEGDLMLAEQDIDMAHRLYSQAKTLIDSRFDPTEASTLNAQLILEDRRSKLVKRIVSRAKDKNLDEFRLREIQISLEFLQLDELTKD